MIENEFKQQIGNPLPNWTSRPQPKKIILEGQYCRLVPVTVSEHLADLYHVYGPESQLSNWTHLPFERFSDQTSFEAHLTSMSQSEEQLHYAIIDKASDKALGSLALMRIDRQQGSVEVGYVTYSDRLKSTRVATEAQFLLASYVFDDLGYRRYEWKCDALNGPSVAAALRLGFSKEGTFRQALVCKGRNRDTTWLSMLDAEWPKQKKQLLDWLNPNNFTPDGRQKKRLKEMN
ncbi:MAG: GNAT family N-acetyltransferase [Lactococcus sp.]|nr:GNAT family protein [Lactococcus sp.]MDN5410191.1 GNAT family N-acetyltransferase [Lactococcus sp.]MDN5412641.1 GNAT family N-acetyltransferase [Lactococcus sp.]MDN5435485.1 GNAT family N-acetyltransferase [Lactococcus sp.]MDN5462549.1 GNAT family N-acetyltransferase [Lactococcus sp.]MDN5466811.1 GNAT family N-acetyltransferase [Lactococcus sp.]